MYGRAQLNELRTRFPAAYCYARNNVALAALYAHRWSNRRSRYGNGTSAADAYDTAFWNFHDTGDWGAFARLVLRHFPATTVVDVGCGQGLALQAFAVANPDLTVRGFDSSATALARARARGLNVEPIDVMALSAPEIAALVARIGQVDLALCLEVAEHLPSWHGGKLLDLVRCGTRLIFSAAHQNQGGHFHVNEQPPGYWIERLERRGFRLSPIDAAFRRELSTLSLPPWYAENAHAFERRDC